MSQKIIKGVIAFLVVLLIGLGVIYAGGRGGLQHNGVSIFMICGLWVFVINWIAFLPAFKFQTEKFYDLVGAFTNSTVILIAAALSQPLSIRSLIVTILVMVWALRLGTFLFKRISKDGKDKRFDAIKPSFLRFLNLWNIQALWVILTTAAAVGIVTSGINKPLGVFAFVGLALWVIGFGVEVIADGQKKAFKDDPANQGKFINVGLWRWSRHPNYFGEIILWLGVAIIALPVLQGWQHVVLISPVFVYLLLTRVSGVPMLEASSDKKWGGQADYDSYKANTPVLMMRPPKAG